jgi:hypothetical protein
MILTEAANCSLCHLLPIATPIVLKVILFQCFYALASLQVSIPAFRHGDLHVSNVLLRRCEVQAHSSQFEGVVVYPDFGVVHRLKDAPWQALLWDANYGGWVCSHRDIRTETLSAQPCPSRHSSPGGGGTRNGNDCDISRYQDIYQLMDSIGFVLINHNNTFRDHRESQEWVEFNVFFDSVLPMRYRNLSVSKSTAQHAQQSTHQTFTGGPDAHQLLQTKYFDQLRQEVTSSDVILDRHVISRLRIQVACDS